MRLSQRLAVTIGALVVSTAAAAEPQPSLDLRNFHPPADPKGSLYLEPSSTPSAGDWNVGAWLSYSHRSVTLEDASGTRVAIPLDNQLSLDYVAAVGVLDRLALSLTLPTVLYQNGDDVNPQLGDGRLPQTALGDAAFGLKANLIPTSALGGFGLAALARVTAPTGDSRSFVSDGTVSGDLRLLGELKLIAVTLQATAGAKVRGQKRTYVGEEFGHDLPWGVALGVHPQAFGLDKGGHWTWSAEARGQLALTPEFGSAHASPALVGLSARYGLGDVSLIGGAELPLNGAVGSPKVRGVLGISWAPRFYDQDGDGISDELDECQELAEDKDGFEDRDGCPDFDNDDDGVPDEEDKCPTEQEDEDGFQDDDGCPDLDNDGDGVPDSVDACPDEAGPATGSAKGAGCPNKDADGDGVEDAADKCIDQPEDKDGFQDTDGCPDPDNDRDGVLDEEDACPLLKGDPRSDPKLNGCPSPDRDGDTFDDAADKCPDQPEDFDGVDDEDGCPDDDGDKPAAARAKPLLTVAQKGDRRTLNFRVAPKLTGKASEVDIDPKTLPSVRALATLLNQNHGWVALVGVRAAGTTPEAEQEALNKSFAVVNTLRSLTHRDDAAESIGWSAVKGQPGAQQRGYGIMIVGPGTAGAGATPELAAPPKASGAAKTPPNAGRLQLKMPAPAAGPTKATAPMGQPKPPTPPVPPTPKKSP
ncbi:MAG: thrombospondin type 3 repeat-containing protein [Myxococcales bacterium]|nr:thrombospondin type 3 repeat-containing protein [Myxococcales bacterium]